MRRLIVRLWPLLGLLLLPALAGPASASEAPSPWKSSVRVKQTFAGPLGRDMLGTGSGTVIASDGDRSVVLTCAHVLESRQKALAVDLFGPDLARQASGPGRLKFLETHAATVIAVDRARDVALLEIRPGRVLDASPVAGAGRTLRPGESAVAIGCPEGADATVWSTRITAVDLPGPKGEPVTECVTAPKQGRSGGGLFTPDGLVIGVCNFARSDSDRGLYAAPSSIHAILAKAGMSPSATGRRFALGGGSSCPPGVPCQPVRPSPQARTEPGYAEVYPIVPPRPQSQPLALPGSNADAAPGLLAILDGQLPEGTPYVAGTVGVAALLWSRDDRRRRRSPALAA